MKKKKFKLSKKRSKRSIRKLIRKQDTIFNEAFYQLQEHKSSCGFTN